LNILSPLTAFFFDLQDRLALVLISLGGLGIMVLLMRPEARASAERLHRAMVRSSGTPLALAVGAALVALAGSRLVFGQFALTRDEVLALFDAETFASGHYAALLPEAWQAQAKALQPELMRRVPGVMVSAYLPLNALFHAPFVWLGAPAVTDAAFVAIAVLATYGCGRRLAPETHAVALVAALLVATSPQVLITGMTAYAYNGHLALIMVWLWLALADDWMSRIAAALVMTIATGLHQFIFPVLVAAPFLLAWFMAGRRLHALFLGAMLALSLGLWVSYPALQLALILPTVQPTLLAVPVLGVPVLAVPVLGGPPVGGDAMAHLRQLIAAHPGLAPMPYNLIRFVVWENPALWLFCGAALWSGWRSPRQWPIWSGCLLAVILFAVVQPSQTHGWGYRYLHAHIGCLALLAGLGFQRLWSEGARPDTVPVMREAVRASLVPMSLLSALLLLPHLAMTTRMFVEPYRRASEQVAAIDADIVIVNMHGIAYGYDLVRNSPTLSRPITLLSVFIDPDGVETLCRQGTVGFFEHDPRKNPGLPFRPGTIPEDKRRLVDRAWYRAHGCTVVN
jgi:hypothetical protein